MEWKIDYASILIGATACLLGVLLGTVAMFFSHSFEDGKTEGYNLAFTQIAEAVESERISYACWETMEKAIRIQGNEIILTNIHYCEN